LKSLKKARISIIGGTGFERILVSAEELVVKTPFGSVSSLYQGEIGNRKIIFLARHGRNHSIPPHKVNYRANIYALHKLGVERVIATNAVGAINRNFKPCDVVVPHDFIDFTKCRPASFYDKPPVTHIDVSQPYCPEIRKLLIQKAKELHLPYRDKAVLVCTEGPRYETPAEIQMFSRLGCDVVGMTGYPENVLARESEMCYGSLCFVSNMAAGIQNRLTASELSDVSKRIMPQVEQLLTETIRILPLQRGNNCQCSNALKDARVR
jgi:5'-methylthioadenosine phosphorylase